MLRGAERSGAGWEPGPAGSRARAIWGLSAKGIRVTADRGVDSGRRGAGTSTPSSQDMCSAGWISFYVSEGASHSQAVFSGAISSQEVFTVALCDAVRGPQAPLPAFNPVGSQPGRKK